VALAALLGPGCGKGPPTPPPARAEALVERFLDAWSRGESPDAFAGPDKPVQATDPDWKAGCRLLSFLSIEASPGPEAPDHFRCRVALSLRDPKGKRVDKEVVYDVQVGQTSVIGRVAR
jgi:hypothetical protein